MIANYVNILDVLIICACYLINIRGRLNEEIFCQHGIYKHQSLRSLKLTLEFVNFE